MVTISKVPALVKDIRTILDDFTYTFTSLGNV